MKKQMLSLLSLWLLSTLSFPLIAKENFPKNAGNSEIELISKSDSSNIPVDELRLFTEIFEQLKNNYVDPISDKTLIHKAISGMLSLDPHSKYYTNDEYWKVKNQTEGSFAGIGIDTHFDDISKKLIIQKVYDDSPAFEAKLEINDQIQKIDDQNIAEIDPQEHTSLLQGKTGSIIKLSLLREGKSFEVLLKRSNIKTPSLSKANLYNHEFAYLKIDRFQQTSSEEIVNALMELEVEAKTQNSEIHGVILDLRGNRGGLLTSAIEVADLFLDGGLITYTDGQAERFRERYEAKKGDVVENTPLIVLINTQSASGSEIVAGALQDHQRALIVGKNSYGKGSIQMVQPLKNGDAIRYTSARYYTPNGNSIQNYGITPDVILPNISAKITTNSAPREIDNLGHLDNPNDQSKNSRMPANFAYLIERGDFPLYEALNILRAMSHSNAALSDEQSDKNRISETL